MVLILTFFQTLLGCLTGLALIFQPKPFLKVVGNAYWHLAKFTAFGKTEETKKYFYTENTVLLRILGFFVLFLGVAGAIARSG